jgi:HD-GYP domain-containing protein (c-di-GMP phosphodiesterase class II)
MEKTKIILIGNNRNLLDLICFSLQTNFRFDVVRFSSIIDFIEYMDENDDFFLVISDFGMGEKQFSNTLKTFMDKKVEVPFFALGATKKFREKNENREAVAEYIGKKNLLEDLVDKIKKYFKVDETQEPKEFCEVAFSVLTSFEGLETDLFIQLPSSGRYLKIFSTEDQITDEDVQKYEGKGVDELFLHKQVSHWLLKTINKDIENIVDKIETFQEVKLVADTPIPEVDESSNIEDNMSAEDALEELNKVDKKVDEVFKFDEAMEKEVTEKVAKTLKAVKKVPALSKLLKKLNVSRNPDQYCKQHINLLCKINTAICHVMDWRQDATIEKLIFVSYLHDITLSDHPHLARIQTLKEFEAKKDQLTEDEQQMFLRHPEIIKDLVDNMPEAPADASNIILQHHETCDGKGFPFAHRSNRLHPLTAVFIIAHDLVSYIMKDPKWKIEDFILIAENKYSGANFNKVLRKLKDLKL